MNTQVDRREHPRGGVLLVVKYLATEEFIEDYSLDASGGGLFVATLKSFTIGEVVDFEISFPGLLEPLSCRGEVRWRRAPDQSTQDKPAGIGVKFIFNSEAEQARVERLIGELIRPPEEPSVEPSVTYQVLVVDHTPIVLEVFSMALEQFQQTGELGDCRMNVLQSSDGEEAWEQLQKENIDLVIIDYRLPTLNGEELIRRIRKDESIGSLPVIMISVMGDILKEVAQRAGADILLEKPTSLNVLLDTVRKLLGIEKNIDPATQEPPGAD